jgi:poly(A) polymerase
VRFSATFDFALDPDTASAIREMAPQITVVSPERIAQEMRRLLVEPGRATGVRLLIETGLAPEILPEIMPGDDAGRQRLEEAIGILERLHQPGFPLALAAILGRIAGGGSAREVGLRWRLANKETDRAAWLIDHQAALAGARDLRWSRLQPILIAEGAEDLLALHEATAPERAEEAAWCRALVRQPRETLDPPPLATGDDLLAHGVPQGPIYKELLGRIRAAQLDGEIHTRDEALALAGRLSHDDHLEP